MFTSLALTTFLLANPLPAGEVAVAGPETSSQATVALVNGLLADTEFQLFQAVFPHEAGDILMVLAPPGFTECIQGALAICGAGQVCSVCFVNTPQQNVCSFICGRPGAPMGCQPQPPCPPTPEPEPDPDPETPTPMPIDPED